MTVALLVVTDGRDDYLERAVDSANLRLAGNITERWMFDDTGDDDYRTRLADRYPEFRHLNAGPRAGFGGAIRSAWKTLSTESTADYVFHLEQDFTFNRTVWLSHMAAVLRRHPYLVQLALRRQPWNDEERAAGGLIERWPGAFTEVADQWLEHRLFFTTNPSLYRRTLCSTEWPDGANSEGIYGQRLLLTGTPEAAGDDVQFGFWGNLASGEAVTHIGTHRAGTGY